MADLGIVARMVAEGDDRDDAKAIVDRVMRMAREQLLAGKSVRLEGIGQLQAPSKPVFVPGSRNRHCRMQRKIGLRNGEVIEKGEAYDRP